MIRDEKFVLEVRDLWFRYPEEEFFVLQALNFVLKSGEIVLIVGKNGSGKTTLLKLLAGLVKPTSGMILWNGKDIFNYPEYSKKIGFVMQYPEDIFLCSNVREEILYASSNLKVGNYEERLARACSLTGLDKEILTKNPFALSHGEARKVAIAAAIAHDPDLLILDEPFIGLDRFGKRAIINILTAWKEHGKSVVLSAQNSNVLKGMDIKVYSLKDCNLERIDIGKDRNIDSLYTT